MTSRRSRLSSALSLPSPIIAVAVGVLCVAYVQLSHSASIPATSSGTNKPSRITTLKTGKPRLEVQAGRMKASDIKACISKAFCEVNSASKTPNYAVNKEFFDLMNQIHALSDEELDSGSTSVEYDDDDDEDDVSGESSEESSSERLRGYPPPPPPPPPGYRRGREMQAGNGTDVGSSSGNGTETGSSTSSTTVSPSKVKGKKEKKSKKDKKKSKIHGQKMVKKYVNGTFISVPKRRSRVETEEEKAEKENYVSRKQREMGQVNDLAALIRISADIGLTLRSPRKCRTLFNKCTMTHEQIVDLFNQTLMAVTTPSTSGAPSSMPTTKRAKVTTTLAAASTSADTPPAESSPLSTVQEALTPTVRTTLLTTQTPVTTTVDDGNRSSKSRHDFSDEDVEYLTDTEIAPVQTYALFVNDAPETEDTQKTAEEVIVQETFKKYANAFPVETALPGDIPSLRKRSNKKKSLKNNGSGRSGSTTNIAKRKYASSEEDEDEEDEEDDDAGSMSVEETADDKNGFRIENPYPGYHVNKGGLADDEKSVESAEPSSAAIGKEDSSEGILPPLVEKQKPNKNKEDEEDDEDEESEESAEADEDAGLGLKGYNGKKSTKLDKSSRIKKNKKSPSVALEEDESSEEEEVEAADEQQQSPPWNPVYQMYMADKKKQGYKKKQKGPYKGGEGLYDDAPSHHAPQSATSSLSSFLKKPWGGANSASQEIPGGGDAAPSSHESGYPAYHTQHAGGHYGGHGGPPGGMPPYGNSQEAGGLAEQKPGFFQSIMSWFTGGGKPAEAGIPHQGEGGYGGGPMHGYGGPAGQPQHLPYGGHGGHGHGSIENDEPEKSAPGAGAPWPSQPDPAGVGHFGQSYRYRGYRKPEVSSEENSEELMEEPAVITKKDKKSKRRYRGRSDSIITSSPKKPATPAKKTNAGPPAPVVVVPKDSKSVAPAGGSPVGVYEPNHQYEKLIQADGGLTSGNGKKVVVVSSTKENKRAKKAAVKPKKQQKKKSQKQSQRAAGHRASRESQQDDDDDEMYSSEEIFNQQVAKLKSGNGGVSLGGSNNGGMYPGGSSNEPNKQSPTGASGASFPSYFESMFGTEEKDKYKIKGQDDGSLLYGFDSLSSQLSPSPLDLPIVQGKKKTSSYKVNKNKKKKKNGAGVLGQPVKFNNKEVIESSEEEADKRKRK